MNAEKIYSLAYNLLKLNVLRIENKDEQWAAKYIDKIVAKPDNFMDSALPGIAECATLLHMAGEDIASKKTTKSVFRGVNNIYKAADASSRDAYKGAWYDKEARQCLCDGYRAVRLNPAFSVSSIPAAPKDMERTDMETLFSHCYEYEASLPLPRLEDVNRRIKEERARRKTERYKKDTPITYDFGEGLPLMNAAYLCDMLNIFDDCTEAKWSGRTNAPIYFKGKAGDGIVLPVRKPA